MNKLHSDIATLLGEIPVDLDDGVAAPRNLVDSDDTSNRLLILDDILPQMLSAFRIAEYNAYLERFEDARVYSTANAFQLVGEKRQFGEVVRQYENRYPQYRGKVLKYTATQDLTSGLVYTIFVNNAFEFIDVCERHGSPFVFTLYPGGDFVYGIKNRIASCVECCHPLVFEKSS